MPMRSREFKCVLPQRVRDLRAVREKCAPLLGGVGFLQGRVTIAVAEWHAACFTLRRDECRNEPR